MGNVLKSIDSFWFFVPIYIVGIFAVIGFIIASYFNSSVSGLIGVGFFAMATAGFILLTPYLKILGSTTDDKKKPTSFSKQLHAFFFGVVLVLGFGVVGYFMPQFSVYVGAPFQIVGESILATATEGLSSIDQILATTVMAPFCETFIFIGHLLISWLIVFQIFGKMLKFSESVKEGLMIAFFLVFSSVTFYFFHVGMVGSIGFLVAVFVYRGLMATFLLGDKFYNILPFMTVVLAVEFGYHWASNVWNSIGFVEWFKVMLFSGNIFGMIAGFFIMLLVGLEIYNIVNRKGSSNE